MTALGFSSEYYHVKIEELLQLSDSKLDLQLKNEYPHIQADDVILFIGKDSKNIADNLFQGRDILLQAQKQGLTHFPTLIMFEQRAPQLGILALLKPIRKNILIFQRKVMKLRLAILLIIISNVI